MNTDRIKNLIYILIVIVLALSLLGFSTGTINLIIEIFVKYILIGAITSLLVGTIIERLTGDTLKKIFLTIEIRGIGISVSAFFVTVIILKFVIFH